MKFLAGFLGLILTLTLFSWIITIVLGKTLINPDVVERNLAASHVYDVAAAEIPKIAVSDISGSEKATIEKGLNQAVTPGYLQTKVETAIATANDYYVNGSDVAPVLDISDFPSRAKQFGVVFPDDKLFKEPIHLTGDPTVTVTARRGFGYYRQSITGTGIVSLLVFIGLVLICFKIRRMTSLITAFAFVGVLCGAVAVALVYFVPRFLKLVPLDDPNVRDFAPAIQSFVIAMAHDVSRGFAWASGITIVIGLVFLVIGIMRGRAVATPTPASVKAA